MVIVKNKKNLLVLSMVLLLALFLRVYRIDNLELFGDELDVGYQAYSILKTGRDYRGNFFPAYIESLSEARAPLFLYSAVPSVWLFGLNHFGVRFPAIFWGLVNILLTYLILNFFFKNQSLGLWAVFLMALTPWHYHYSRAGFEVTLLLSLILAGSFLYLKGYLLLAFICYGLSFYAYNTANIFVPLLLLFLFLTEREKIKKNFKTYLLPGLIFLVIVFPLGIKILTGQASARFQAISIFSSQKLIDRVIEKRSLSNQFFTRIFYNKPLAWGNELIKNYLTAFSPQFLFLNGDPNPRHTVPGFGLLPIGLLFPLLWGFFYSLKNFKTFEYRFWLFWFLIAPVAAALTFEGGSQATRLFLALPSLIFFSSLGIKQIWEKRWGRYFIVLLIFVVIFNFLAYFHEVFVYYPKDQYRYWHYGYREAVKIIETNKEKCRQIYVNNTHEPFLIRYLFWAKVDPAWFQENFQDDKENLRLNALFLYFKVGNVYFGRLTVADKLEGVKALVKEGNCYYAFQKDEIPGDWNFETEPPEGIRVLGTVKDPWGKPYSYLLGRNNEIR